METQADVRDVLAFLRGLVSQPDGLVAIKLRDTHDIVVVERGQGGEGDLVAVRLLPPYGRRTVLGQLTGGRIRWQSSHMALPVRDQPAACQVLGRVLSVIHPVSANVQTQAA